MTCRRLPLAVVLALVPLLVAAGCARAKPELGTGPDVGFCDGWAELDALPEPPLADRGEVMRWTQGALRVLDRIDTRVKVTIDRRSRPLPAQVVTELKAVAKDLEGFRDRVERARGEDAVRRAVVDLSRSGYDARADRLTRFRGDLCPQ